MKLKLLVTSCWLLLCLIAYAGHRYPEIRSGAGSYQLHPVPGKQVRPLQHFSACTEKTPCGRQPCCPALARSSTNGARQTAVVSDMIEP